LTQPEWKGDVFPHGVSVGQTNEFFELLTDLAADADAARRELIAT